MVQLDFDRFPWPDQKLAQFFVPTQLLFTAAILAYAVGNAIPRRSRPSHGRGAEFKASRLWLLALAGVALLIPVLTLTGGIAGRFRTREDVGRAIALSGVTETNTIQLFFLQRLPIACVLVLVYGVVWWLRSGVGTATSRRRGWLLMLVTLVLAVLLTNPYSNPRYLAFSTAGAALLGLFRLSSRRRRAIFAITMTAATLTIYPLATYFKKQNLQSHQRISGETFTGIDFDGFQMSVNTMYYVSTHGIAMGKHILGAIFFLVPRSIWDGKPIPASFDVASSRGYEFQNLSLPLWSELYLDLGVVGMIIVMFLLGRISRRLDSAYASGGGASAEHIAAIVAVSQVGLIRGPLGGSAVFFGSVLIVGLAVFVGSWRHSENLAYEQEPERAVGARDQKA